MDRMKRSQLENAIEDYLISKGYRSTAECLVAERMKEQCSILPSSPNDDSSLPIQSILKTFDTGSLVEFKILWDRHVVAAVSHQLSEDTLPRLYFKIQVHFGLFPLRASQLARAGGDVHIANSRAAKAMKAFQEYLKNDENAADLCNVEEFIPYFALPSIANPSNHPSFTHILNEGSSWLSDIRSELSAVLCLFDSSKKQSEDLLLEKLFKNHTATSHREEKNISTNAVVPVWTRHLYTLSQDLLRALQEDNVAPSQAFLSYSKDRLEYFASKMIGKQQDDQESYDLNAIAACDNTTTSSSSLLTHTNNNIVIPTRPSVEAPQKSTNHELDIESIKTKALVPNIEQLLDKSIVLENDELMKKVRNVCLVLQALRHRVLLQKSTSTTLIKKEFFSSYFLNLVFKQHSRKEIQSTLLRLMSAVIVHQENSVIAFTNAVLELVEYYIIPPLVVAKNLSSELNTQRLILISVVLNYLPNSTTIVLKNQKFLPWLLKNNESRCCDIILQSICSTWTGRLHVFTSEASKDLIIACCNNTSSALEECLYQVLKLKEIQVVAQVLQLESSIGEEGLSEDSQVLQKVKHRLLVEESEEEDCVLSVSQAKLLLPEKVRTTTSIVPSSLLDEESDTLVPDFENLNEVADETLLRKYYVHSDSFSPHDHRVIKPLKTSYEVASDVEVARQVEVPVEVEVPVPVEFPVELTEKQQKKKAEAEDIFKSRSLLCRTPPT